MPSWSFEEIRQILSMYPKDTTSVFFQCEFHRPGFTVLNWDIEDCSLRLCRGTTLTDDVILLASINHGDLKIKVIELYYVKEDTCAIVHLYLNARQIINYYRETGPTLADFENAGINVQEFRKEKFRL